MNIGHLNHYIKKTKKTFHLQYLTFNIFKPTCGLNGSLNVEALVLSKIFQISEQV